jgi:hypothetical protein
MDINGLLVESWDSVGPFEPRGHVWQMYKDTPLMRRITARHTYHHKAILPSGDTMAVPKNKVLWKDLGMSN